MKKILVVLILFCAFFMISCGSDSSKPVSGGEDSVTNFGKLGSECYPNKTCDAGLLCDEESNTCIEDPENSFNDSDNSSKQTNDNADTSSEQNDADSGANSGDSAPDNPWNCSPASATPCIDFETDLIWSGKSVEKMQWANAVEYCKNLKEGGYNDWHLPGIAVLSTLIQNCRYDAENGCIGDTDGKYSKFGDIVFLWSSTSENSEASGIYFFNGAAQSKSVYENFNVRCVRNLKCDDNLFNITEKKCVNPCDSKPCDSSEIIIDATCVPLTSKRYSCGGKDPSSGLIWSAKARQSMDWGAAVSYCDNLSEGGYSDWHLPTISELRTLIQNCSNTESEGECGVTDSCFSHDCSNAACNGCSSDSSGKYSKFGETEDFWSSSLSDSNSTSLAWRVTFYNGEVTSGEDYSSSVRCVR